MRRGPKGDRVFQPDAELVIEGYPRSGNSFSEAAFLVAQGRPVELGHHTHAAAHVVAATRAGIPCLVVIREPVDAARSLVQMDPMVFDPAFALWEYCMFYRAVARVRSEVVVATFDTITEDFGAVIAALNSRFRTSFEYFDHTEENEAAAFALLDEISRQRGVGRGPTEAYSPHADEERRANREEDKRRYGRLFDDPALATRRAEAERIYEVLARTADA